MHACSCGKCSKAHEAFIAFNVSGGIKLKSVAVGKGYVLDPLLQQQQATDPPSFKYVLVLLAEKSMEEFVSQAVSLGQRVVSDLPSHDNLGMLLLLQMVTKGLKSQCKLLQKEMADNSSLDTRRRTFLAAHEAHLKNPSDNRKELLARVEREKEELLRREERSTRRRTRALAPAEEEDPTDKQTFTLYPVELESQVTGATLLYASTVSDHSSNKWLVQSLPRVTDAQDVITVSRGDLKRLCPGVYFNDNLIDLRVKHLVFGLSPSDQSRLHAFSCMFYTKLLEQGNKKKGHALVARWTKNFDVFAKDFIFIPVNESAHWSLAVIAHPGHISVSSLSPPLQCSYHEQSLIDRYRYR